MLYVESLTKSLCISCFVCRKYKCSHRSLSRPRTAHEKDLQVDDVMTLGISKLSDYRSQVIYPFSPSSSWWCQTKSECEALPIFGILERNTTTTTSHVNFRLPSNEFWRRRFSVRLDAALFYLLADTDISININAQLSNHVQVSCTESDL